ncbi:DUF5313 domain-containing protein [Rhodococcus triatomae]|uniref:DUF5313 domain-containing protein n=1 Tax=Rhodococcus triatomae TaxID=300028 RepID=A0A1G8KIS3_9NOCA|nr:DUF5313 family protein [Rhodococcus triatomae]QNG18938.1 DUF5313 domain-containing protein [Rhodococcus triatomae]QNG25149.1 DUF5313 domain-containing protein [Rhodococcus triatomae]SDI43285.1 hypothetical protein SAMN05444695_107156 [Rhodococcus triatomae]
MTASRRSRPERRRPGPLQWLGYAFGRTLPDSQRDWVRNDLVGNHAVARHLVRSMAPFVPVFAAFALFPGPVALRASMVLLGVLLALFYSVAYMAQNRARRLERHGLPADLENPKAARRHENERRTYERRHGRAP